MTNTEDFKQSLSFNQPPAGLNVYLESLWYDGKGNWDRSHEVIQDVPDKTASWIHAYLHRKEGDIWNADYWYGKAGRTRPAVSLDNEWETLVEYCLGI
ncbi:hypothetical protein QTN47_23090 [Danxiaibacter flavus]|uniref:Uncharacterized protein n=1 Tax=Danxiaibacter flavus TaxID=3049108 RepID=A0ABV3ZKK3_9BACT|nr:hypothetical protein QNM32_23095 [Chitinophagaceae bacterium DXS]